MGSADIDVQMQRTVSQASNAGLMGRIDLLACNLAADSGKHNELVRQLEDLTGFNVCASDNLTGDKAQNGDWVLETDGVDAAKWYFESEKLALWHQTACFGQASCSTGETVCCLVTCPLWFVPACICLTGYSV